MNIHFMTHILYGFFAQTEKLEGEIPVSLKITKYLKVKPPLMKYTT